MKILENKLTPKLRAKFKNLVETIKKMKSILVAYSGGVDSTFLIKVAKETIGDNLLAVTARSLTYPKKEYEQARRIAQKLKVKHLTIDTEELSNRSFVANPITRCYYCKKELFSKLKRIAKEQGINYVVDGANFDDLNDFRPGSKAAKEMGIRSPLQEAKLTKEEIRLLSHKIGLPTWDKPALACLASRVPYGQKITEEKLKMINEAEEYLRELGFRQVRVRHHASSESGENGPLARIEVFERDVERLVALRKKIVKKFQKIGYRYITSDLQCYRPGSLNPLTQRRRRVS